MNIWIIAVVVGLLAVAGFVAANTLQIGDAGDSDAGDLECSTCGNSCTAESNCGRATCGAVTGGSCGCRG